MNLRFVLGIIVVASLPIAAAPMQELTLEQILQKNEEALGGRAAIRPCWRYTWAGEPES